MRWAEFLGALAPEFGAKLLSCEVPADYPVDLVQVYYDDAVATPLPDGAEGNITDGILSILVPPSQGRVRLVWPSVGEAEVLYEGPASSDGAFECVSVGELVYHTGVHGTVQIDGGAGSVRVFGCNENANIASDGTFFLSVATQPCDLAAYMYIEDEESWYRGENVFIEPRLGEDIHGVELLFSLDEAVPAEVNGFELAQEKWVRWANAQLELMTAMQD
jgi:hypothetical protein